MVADLNQTRAGNWNGTNDVDCLTTFGGYTPPPANAVNNTEHTTVLLGLN